MATLITPEGTVTEVHPVKGKKFTLDAMYALLGCSMVERVKLPNHRWMWVDEEGFCKTPLPAFNRTAWTLLADAAAARAVTAKRPALFGEPPGPIVGTVLVTGPGES